MAVATCLIRSLILKPGEPFVLPPGAEVIGTTNVDDIDSTCADLTGLETLTCFTCVIPYKRESAGTRYYDNGGNEGIQITGYKLNGIDALLTNPHNPDQLVNNPFIESFDGNSVAADVASKVGAVAHGNDFYVDNNDLVTYIHIQTIPSIGNNLSLKTNVSSAESLLVNANAAVYYPFVLSSTIGVGLPDLPCTPAPLT